MLKSKSCIFRQSLKTIGNHAFPIQETMQKIQEQAEQNNLISDELVDKFSQFQELLDEMMSPELLEAMEKMQEAMEEMDTQKLLDALENFDLIGLDPAMFPRLDSISLIRFMAVSG